MQRESVKSLSPSMFGKNPVFLSLFVAHLVRTVSPVAVICISVITKDDDYLSYFLANLDLLF